MAFKVSSSKLIKIIKLLERADSAMNILERDGKNKILFTDLKKEIQDEVAEVKVMYDLESFDEWNKKEKLKKESL